MSGRVDDPKDAARGRVLVVDDSRTMRQKLTIAARNLGCDVEEAEGGAEALARLTDTHAAPVDLVLLDIVMPGIDGFEVLRRMTADPALRDVPVLVISSLEEMADTVRAIELGATDFLSKRFDRLIFKARVEAALEWRRLRLRELDYLAEVRRLLDAARTVETAGFDPAGLSLDTLAARHDPLGDLARVFVNMVGEVNRRELALRAQIALLKGAFLLLLIAVPYALFPSLSRLMAFEEMHPVGTAAAVSLGSATLLTALSLVRGRLPSFAPARLGFAAKVSLVGTSLPMILVLWAASHLGAAMITVLLAAESLFVFVLAALLGQERPDPLRFLGICLGLGAILLTVLPQFAGLERIGLMWVLPVLLAALLYASEVVLLGQQKAHPDDAIQTTTLIALVGAAVTVPTALALGAMPPLDVLIGAYGPLIPALAAISAFTSVLVVLTVERTGAVFASQANVPLVLAGVLWAVALVGETLPSTLWVALAIMIVGLILVRPRMAEETLPAAAGTAPAR